jgi:hypothetical protein
MSPRVGACSTLQKSRLPWLAPPATRDAGPRSGIPGAQSEEEIMPLNLNPNFSETGKRYFSAYSPGDDFYEMLINTHRDLSDEQSELLNARLILLLANHIGDIGTLREALNAAREGV